MQGKDMLSVGGTSVTSMTTKVIKLFVAQDLGRTLSLDGTGKGLKGNDVVPKNGFQASCPFLYAFIVGKYVINTIGVY